MKTKTKSTKTKSKLNLLWIQFQWKKNYTFPLQLSRDTLNTRHRSSNSLRFNSILQKFYEMICEILISRTMCGIFLIFVVRVLLMVSFWRANFGTIATFSDPFIFKKFRQTVLKILSAQNKLEKLLFKIFFFKDLEQFLRMQNHLFGRHFSVQKINFIPFFKCDYTLF